MSKRCINCGDPHHNPNMGTCDICSDLWYTHRIRDFYIRGGIDIETYEARYGPMQNGVEDRP